MTAIAPPLPVTRTTITLSRTVLRAALARVSGVLEQRATAHAVAQHIYLSAVNDVLTLEGTNFDAWASVSVPCAAPELLVALLPAKPLTDIVALLPAGEVVRLSVEGLTAVITAGRARFELTGLDPTDFPALPALTGTAHAEVEAAPLLSAMTRAVDHASTAESRPELNVVRLENREGVLWAVASDSASLAALVVGTLTGDGTLTAPVSVHRASVGLFARVFGGAPAEATLSIDADGLRVRVTSEDAMLQVRAIDQPFPAYQRLLVQPEITHTIVCEREALLTTIKRVAITADEKQRLEFVFGGSEITVRAEGEGKTSRGEDVVPIALRQYSVIVESDSDPIMPPFRCWVNATNFAAALQSLEGERVAITASTPEAFLFLRADSPFDASLILVAPLRTF